MKIVSVVNQKGGCGKTITAVNMAAALSKKGQKVLLIDLGPQAHATFSLNKKAEINITEILDKICDNQELSKDNLYSSISDNFYFIPSSIGLAAMEHKLATRGDKLQILSLFLMNLMTDFDYCILDCPPNLGIITLNALWVSNYSVIPLGICDFSLRGIELLKNIFIMLKEFKGAAPTPFYLLSQMDKRSRFAREFTERTKKQLGSMLLKTAIRTNIHLREAASSGQNIFEYKSDSRGAEDFMLLADEMEKLTSQTKWAPLFFKGEKFNEIYVVGDFTNWQKDENYKLNKIGSDIWGINIPLKEGRYRYKFLAENSWVNDPYNQIMEDDPFGGKNSLLTIE